MKSTQEFATTYQHMSDDQLLQIANEAGLIPQADQALTEELHRRNLKLSDLPRPKESHQTRLERATEEKWLPLERYRWGFGFYGRNYLSESDKESNIQLRTKFFVFAGFPLIPIASYRFKCSGGPGKWFQWNTDQHALNRVPLAWAQVLMTWLKTLLGIVAIFGLIVIYERFKGR